MPRTHPPRTARAVRPARVLAVAVAAGALLATAACAGGDDSATAEADTAVSTRAERPVAQRPLAQPTPTPSPDPRLTAVGARTALITEGDLEDDWNQVSNAATWRNRLLIGQVDTAAFLTARTNAADCQRLLDALYDETLLGEPSGPSALTGFTEGDSRLLYQVATYERAQLDKSLKWLEALPETCDEFTATGAGGTRTVQVVEASLPDEGDARQAVTVTVRGDAYGSPITLTLDVAAVRVGTNALTVTNGGTGGADHDSTEDAVRQGSQRLEDVLAGRTPKAQPSELE
ncbi:hypothetical protein [Streptomyces sp. A012304]|uniref:hypothetical protein n=1 Tax=Streptomyces sp. A012304 TaxID=375446 RepID=UPI0022325DE0|nr:hypothetical protein [Streptomyces sp. A012304]